MPMRNGSLAATGERLASFSGPAGTDRLVRWLATNGVQIVLWVLAAALIIRFVNWGLARYAQRIDREFEGSDLIVRTETTKHRRALVEVVGWTVIGIVVLVAGLQVLMALGLPVTSLVGPGAVLGAALGFGAQRVVQDLLAGFFIVTEKQYGYGDVVELTLTGGSDATGTVEDVNLRVTKLRASDGEVVTVPNGQIVKSTNLSKDWARAVVDIPIPAEADIGQVNEILGRVGAEFFSDRNMHRLLLDAPAPLGVTDLELDSMTVRMVARTLPGKQFEISRALRARIIRALARAGITIAPGRDVLSGSTPPTGLEPSETRGDA
ncbi:mechanosensitive ion channel family protein [Gordonia sp. TBRC 11910]|uniref:Mechanosensitive ion channel family protein n=1 Tax=Gordonia asplenii TaxID=2725283 RepID=A0A848KYE4_9ACTN|nr:mechanosensitive ion channel family protein [Gordonia asplenii]NMO01875.1 mechanosensitive ion channel family protein [Gordonia asplenii]